MAKTTGVKKTAAKKPSAKKAKAMAASANDRYRELLDKAADRKAEPYRMTNMYALETKIEHPKFGLGIVVGSWVDKIEVVFEDTSRHLVQNRK